MQLSREELSKLDLIIERYTDDTTSKEAVAIRNLPKQNRQLRT
ncbi:MAG: hypothetical protein E7J16_04810 [Gemella haemolysans]|nr:hypothetical protein [Gemella haemolysans]